MNLNISPRYLQFRGPNGESPIPFLPCETRETPCPTWIIYGIHLRILAPLPGR